jgi:hypothetical protein
VDTVPAKGWSGIKNGQLLQQAAIEFDYFLTVDRNLQFQQPLTELPVAVIVAAAVNNKLATLKPLVPEILKALAEMKRGELRVVGV